MSNLRTLLMHIYRILRRTGRTVYVKNVHRIQTAQFRRVQRSAMHDMAQQEAQLLLWLPIVLPIRRTVD